MNKAFSFKVYPLTLAANAVARLPVSGSYFRIQSATGAVDVTVEGVGTLPDLLGGQAFKDLDFNGLIIQDKSGAPNTLQILIASAEFQDNRLQGAVALTAPVDLSVATMAAMRAPLAPTGNFSNVGAIAINTATTIFTPGANLNGAILLSAMVVGNEGSNGVVSFLAKASSPVAVNDGEVLHAVNIFAGNLANPVLPFPQFVPAGLGLYMFNTLGLSAAAQNLRAARFRLL
jgi:hypothetical protein